MARKDANKKGKDAPSTTPVASSSSSSGAPAGVSQAARKAALAQRRPDPVKQLRDGAIVLLAQFCFLGIATIASYASQLALSPVYGEHPAGIYHSKIATVAYIVGWASMSLIEGAIPHPELVLALFCAYSPFAQSALFQFSDRWGPEIGPVWTEAVTTYPIIFLAAFNGARILKNGPLTSAQSGAFGHLIPGVASFRLFQTTLGLYKYQLGPYLGSNQFWTRCGLQSAISFLSALFSAKTTLVSLVAPGLIWNHVANPRCTWNGGSANGKATVEATLKRENFTLIERTESVTGYLSVLENNAQGYKLLRCDHSVLGGEWLKVPAGYENNVTPLREPIYAVFAMMEAVRLVQPAPKAEEKSALVIGLGIGTAVNGLLTQGITTTVVELDPAVHRLATDHFGLLPNHTAHLENALTFVARETRTPPAFTKRYSYILHDVFTGGAVPPSLYTKEFLTKLKLLLQRDGVIAINYAGDLLLAPSARIINTIFNVFDKRCRVFREDATPTDEEIAEKGRDFTNIVVFCINSVENPDAPIPGFDFRAATSWDFMGTYARRNFLVPRHEVNVASKFGKVPGGEELLTVENASQLAAQQEESAVGHWKVMRGVLPSAVWENY